MEEKIQSIRDLDAEEIDLSIKSTSYTQNIKELDAEKVDISTKLRSNTGYIFFPQPFLLHPLHHHLHHCPCYIIQIKVLLIRLKFMISPHELVYSKVKPTL